MTYALWIVQGLLALLFLFAGGVKLVLPLEELTKQMPLPGPFVRFIGVAEVLGAIGLILPGLLRIRPGLTPLAAAGLVIIMIGATVLTLAGGDVAPALIPLVVGLLFGVRRLRPLAAGPASRTHGFHGTTSNAPLGLMAWPSLRFAVDATGVCKGSSDEGYDGGTGDEHRRIVQGAARRHTRRHGRPCRARRSAR